MLVQISHNIAINPKDVKFIQNEPYRKTKIVLDGHTIIVEEMMQDVLEKLNGSVVK